MCDHVCVGFRIARRLSPGLPRLALSTIVSMFMALSSLPLPAAASAASRDPAFTQGIVSSVLDRGMAEAINSAIPTDNGVWGVAVKDLQTGHSAFLNADASFPSASLVKLPIMVEFYRQRALGAVSPDDVMTVGPDDVEDDGVNTIGDVDSQVSTGQALQLMITISDNVAANTLATKLGRGQINQTLAALGFATTRMHTWDEGDPIPPDGDNYTTPLDMLKLLELIAAGRAVDAQSSREMLDLLLADEINDRLPAGLPPNTPIAHKTGNLAGALHDAAIVYSPKGAYAIVVMSNNVEDEDAAIASFANISAAAYKYLNR